MAGEVDDLKVSYQVVHARASGARGPRIVLHTCLAGSMAGCVAAGHGYYLRLPGPLTKEAHEDEQRRIARFDGAEHDAFMQRVIDAVHREPAGL